MVKVFIDSLIVFIPKSPNFCFLPFFLVLVLFPSRKYIRYHVILRFYLRDLSPQHLISLKLISGIGSTYFFWKFFLK